MSKRVKIKTFHSNNLRELDEQVNKFIEKIDYYAIEDIKMASDETGMGVMIIYDIDKLSINKRID